MSDLEVVNKAKNKAIRRAEIAEKRIVELEQKISVLLSCKNCPENNGGYICQKEYENKCLAQKIQYIKELQEENAELKAENEANENGAKKYAEFYFETNNQLTKAKELLNQFLEHYKAKTIYVENMSSLLADAENFLKDSEVEK